MNVRVPIHTDTYKYAYTPTLEIHRCVHLHMNIHRHMHVHILEIMN